MAKDTSTIKFGLRTNDAILDWLQKYKKSIPESLAPKIAKHVIQAFQAEMRQRLTQPQNKTFGKPIQTKRSGGIMDSINNENWTVSIGSKSFSIHWSPDPSVTSTSRTHGKFFAIDYGSPVPKKRHPGYEPATTERKSINQLTGEVSMVKSRSTVRPTKDRFRANNPDFEDGPFRQAIKAWVTAKGIPVHYMAIVHGIMGDTYNPETKQWDDTRKKSTTQPSSPKFLSGGADALFVGGEDFPYSQLTAKGLKIVNDAIKKALNEDPFPKLKRSRGGKGTVTEQELMEIGGEIISSNIRYDDSGRPYRIFQAVVRNPLGQFSSAPEISGATSARVYEE